MHSLSSRRQLATRICAIALSFFFLALAEVHGATITVTNKNNSGAGSLRQALADSVDGGTINFSVTPGAITLTSGELVVGKSITISGPGAASLAIDGNASSRVFHITTGKTVMISGLTIRNGLASGSVPSDLGGGIYNEHATLTITNSAISLNHADYGGGIYNNGQSGGSSAMLTISNSTLSGNSSSGNGGGIYNDGLSGSATLTITNATISGNSTGGYGGGIYNIGLSGGNATLAIRNGTLSGNSAAGTLGGGIYNYGQSGSATLEIANTILNRGGASGGNIHNQSGTVTSDGFNLSSDDSSAFLNQSTDQISTDPKLGPLEDNGGPTFTHELLLGSPAIDKGKDLSGTGTDQRGRTRPVDDPFEPNATGSDGSDIGAFELVRHLVTTTNDKNLGSLRQALATSLDGDLIYFESALNYSTITLSSGELVVSKSVTISGPGAATLAVDANHTSRVFSIGVGKTVTISGLTIRNGQPGGGGAGGILNDHAKLTVTKCTLSGNSASTGAGIYNDGSGPGSASLTVTNSTLSGNTAGFEGGGISTTVSPAAHC